LSLCSWPELSELSSPCNWLFPSSEWCSNGSWLLA
jgi:hypothetical protein